MTAETETTIAAVMVADQIYHPGDIVTFCSEYQHGTARIETLRPGRRIAYPVVTLKGIDVTSRWGQTMVSGNAIMGPAGIITGKV